MQTPLLPQETTTESGSTGVHVGDSFGVGELSHLDQLGHLYWQVARDQRSIAVHTVLRYQQRDPMEVSC